VPTCAGQQQCLISSSVPLRFWNWLLHAAQCGAAAKALQQLYRVHLWLSYRQVSGILSGVQQLLPGTLQQQQPVMENAPQIVHSALTLLPPQLLVRRWLLGLMGHHTSCGLTTPWMDPHAAETEHLLPGAKVL